jgi:deoxyribose-phosphate aldolase
MVLNYTQLLAGERAAVLADVQAVRDAAPSPTVLKVIVETSQLDAGAIRLACDIVVAAGADFIKTSTGFNGRGASVEDVALMKEGVKGKAKIKASGGVRSLADCKRMVEAGAERIGASAGVTIVKEARGEGEELGGVGSSGY